MPGPPRNLIRALVGIALCVALAAAAAVPIPEVLPAIAIGQAVVYKLEVALVVFYGVLLLITPALSGLGHGRLPIEISTRGAKFADEMDESADTMRASIERLEQVTYELKDELTTMNLQITEMKEEP